METSSKASKELHFLSGGGEMGDIISAIDWMRTPLGPAERWPYSLRSTLGIMLHSAFPQFLFWGKDLVCFYNDAFRPSLGANGKHPAIGKRGKEVWAEIWDFIGPLIEQVLTTGKAVRFEDQLVPFYRNGGIEDIYWTFSYSPAYGDDGAISGVFVTCTETTEKVRMLNSLSQSQDELQFAIEAAELATFDYNPQTNRFKANARLKEWFGLPPEAELDLEIALSVIVDKDRERVSQAIGDSLNHGAGGKYEVEYSLTNPLTGLERAVRAKGICTFNENREATRLSGTLQDITSESISRQKTGEEKERRELAIAAGEFGVFEVDLITNKIITDDRFNAIYGFKQTGSREEYIATCHPDDLPIRAQALSAGLVNGFFDYETRFFYHGKEVRWLRSKGNVIYNEKKEPHKIYGVIQDITDQKLFSSLLQERELQMRSMIENAPFAIAVYIGRDMRIQFANSSIIEIWGKGNDVIGRSFKEVLPELDNQEVFKQIDQVFDTGVAFHIQNQPLDLVVNNELRLYYFNYSFTPLFDHEGNVYGVMNTGVDLTELNLAKQAIQKSEANLRNTILQAPVAMCIFKGREHVVSLANERMFALWGRPAKELLNRPIFEGLPEARDQGFEALLDGVYTTGKTFSAHGQPVNLPREDEVETVYVNVVFEAYREAGGVISGVLAVAVDVTAQVLARQQIEEIVAKRTRELADANKGLQKSNAELAQFAYIASHDLQEPLRKISNFSQMLELRITGQLDPTSKNYLNKINEATARMTALIRDVLTYSELDSKEDVFSAVNLNQVVKNTITDYELLIEQKQARVEMGDLPVVKAIPLQMAQLFGNLVGNSLKFARKDVSPLIKIDALPLSPEDREHSSLDPSLDYIKIRIADNGIGFKEEYTRKIFSIFQRLHRKSEYEGTGIGLAMCKKIALNHNGEINAVGSSENGAVFNFIMPVR